VYELSNVLGHTYHIEGVKPIKRQAGATTCDVRQQYCIENSHISENQTPHLSAFNAAARIALTPLLSTSSCLDPETAKTCAACAETRTQAAYISSKRMACASGLVSQEMCHESALASDPQTRCVRRSTLRGILGSVSGYHALKHIATSSSKKQ
jgi:hypothetical protein